MTIRHRTRSPLPKPAQPVEEVGYSKPPEHARFQAGKSGNPKGRPRGSVSSAKHLRESLRKTMPVSIDGKPMRMRRDQAFFEGLLRDALKGDNAARRMVFKAMETIAAEERNHEAAAESAPVAGPADRDILERYRREAVEDYLREQHKSDGKDPEDDG